MPLPESVAATTGIPGDDVTHWGLARKEGKSWVRQGFPGPTGTHAKEWPIGDLTLEALNERCRTGDYRCFWVIRDPTHAQTEMRCRSGGNGREFSFTDTPSAPEPPAPREADLFPPELSKGMAIMDLIDRRSNRQIEGLAKMAELFASRSSGTDATAMQLILQNQQLQFQSLIERLDAKHETARQETMREIASLRTELASFEEEPETSAAAPVANAVKEIRVKPGESAWESIKASFTSYALNHPDEAIGVIKTIPEVLKGIASLNRQAEEKKRPVARPALRAVPAQEEVPPEPPRPAAPPAGPGLNGFLTKPSSEPAHAPPAKA